MQSLAFMRASHNPCQRRVMTVSTNNGLVNGPAHNLLMQFFTLGSSKIEVFETCFLDIVTTQYDHPRYVKHVLGRIYMFFTLFGYYVSRATATPSSRSSRVRGPATPTHGMPSLVPYRGTPSATSRGCSRGCRRTGGGSRTSSTT